MTSAAVKENELKLRFLSIWKKCQDKSERPVQPEIVWDLLIQHYGASKRRYHNFNHVIHCLTEMDRAWKQIEMPYAVVMAILFHDVIYEPNAKDNEKRSAHLFELIHHSSFEEHFIFRVKQLILATTHQHKPSNNDEKIICDIDLSSFALPWKLFLKDSHAVRSEFATIPDRIYYRNKRIFLKSLLLRPRIFYSRFFYQRYEQAARKNIKRFLCKLALE